MIAHLVEAAPDWVKVINLTKSLLVVVATPTKPGGGRCRPIELAISENTNKVEVSETQAGTRLPRACPERHINSDGTFCVGLDAGKSIHNKDKAERWWAYLAEYIICQEFASKNGRWPPGKQLSHGDAAEFQLKAEVYARDLELEQEYQDAVEHRISWLAEYLPKCSKTEKRLLNGRAGCPKGCKTNAGAPLLRRECKRPEKMWGLISNETKRRRAEQGFNKSYMSLSNFECCGTMRHCPFR